MAVIAIVIPASAAWACVGLVVFTTTGSATVEPGGTIQVFGGEFASEQPVDVHLDSLSNPVLATFPSPEPSTMTSRFTLDVPIPADTPPGEHVLIANQNHYDMNGGIPARATIYVGTPEGGPPAPEQRPAGVVAEAGMGTGTLVLVGALAAAGALLLAAGARAFAARQPATTGTPGGEG